MKTNTKHFVILAGLILFWLCNSFSQEYTSDTNTVALYHFNETSGDTVHDESGFNNHGLCTNTSIVSGKFNNARAILGNINIPHNNILSYNGSGMTIEAWIFMYAPSNGQIIWKGTGNTDVTCEYGLFTYNNTQLLSFHAGHEMWGSLSGVMPLNQWNHVAAVIEGSIVKQYVNGVLVRTDYDVSVPVLTEPLYFGNVPGLDTWGSQFLIDEVRISNKAREPWEFNYPVVKYVTPIQNALNVFKTTDISATFNVAMNTGTFTASNIIVHGMQSGKHTGTITLSGDTAFTFNPNTDFMPGEIVIVALAKGITSATGDSLTNGYHWSFTVASTPSTGTFATQVDYTTGSISLSVFVSDVDGDEDGDLAVTNYNSNTVSILKNNGDGTYQAKVDYGTGILPRTVFVMDVDGDGDGDLVVVNSSSNTVSILKNTGDGTYQSKVDYGTGILPHSVFVNDVDGDGDGDLVVANYSSNTVSILKNNGDGTFQIKVDYTTGANPTSVFVSDVDGDGDADLAVACRFSDVVSIFKNNGDGTFQSKVDYTTGSNPYSVFVNDLDGDGDGDLAVANVNANTVSILKNNGDGIFQEKVDYTTTTDTYSFFMSDVDGDGDEDLVVANVYSNTISILKNNSDGTFQAKVDYTAGDNPQSVFVSDLDGDGDGDVVVANYGSNTVSILKNIGIDTSLVAYYPFNNNANDESGNGHDGTPVGVTPAADRFGIANSAYSFIGTINSYVDVGNLGLTNNFTISGWIKLNSFSSVGSELVSNLSQSPDAGYDFLITGLAEGQKLRLNINNGPYTTDNDTTFSTNRWWYIACTYDNLGTVKLYISGDLVETQSGFPALNPSPLNTFIGKSAYNNNYTNGLIDDIRIYNRALSPSEIDSLYHLDGWDTDTSLVAYYPFNGNAHDESGNGNDGTVNGATLTTDRFGSASRAYSFDGIESNILVSQSTPILNLGWSEYTVSEWFNTSDVSKTAQTVFNTYPHNGIGIDFNYYPQGTMYYSVGNGSAWDSVVVPGVKANFQQNTWYFATLVKNGTTYDFYINGILDKSLIVPASSGYNLDVGCRFGTIGPHPIFGGLWEMFIGKLDDYRIYNRALSEAEIDLLYREGGWPLAPVYTSSISGMKFNDLDGNGSKELSEPGIANWRIRLIKDGGQIDSTLTNSSGRYTFDSLAAGTYTVREKMEASWTQTAPPTGEFTNIIIDTDTGVAVVGRDFGNRSTLGTIAGTKFNDINSNGVRDAGEPGIPNWRIRLLTGSEQIDSTLTDVNGNFSFSSLAAGTYAVQEKMESGWHQSAPPEGEYGHIELSGAGTITGIDFGNYQTAQRIRITLEVHDASGSPVQSIVFGTRSGAAFGIWEVDPQATAIDEVEGEFELPPIPPNFLDARFVNPRGLPNLFGKGSWTDVRNFVKLTQVDTYRVSFQAGTAGYPMTIRWSKQLVSQSYTGDVHIIDAVFGSHDMKTLDSLVITNSSVTSVLIVTSGPSLRYAFSTGWSMVSLPNVVLDPSVHTLFPTAGSHAFLFNPIQGYVVTDELEPGGGYWVKFLSPGDSMSLAGEPRLSDTLDLVEGWNMIGTLSEAIDVASVTSNPPDVIVSDFFGYSNGYFVTTSLDPIKAYWIKVSSNAQLYLTSGSLNMAKLTTAVDESPNYNSFHIEDAERNNATLYLVDETQVTNDLSRYELPPKPPDGIFDVRFSNNRKLECINTGIAKDIPIEISSAHYPLTINWEIKQTSTDILMNVDGKEIVMRGCGTTQIINPESRITLMNSVAFKVPQDFVLEQNIPNPFNPSTIFKYTLPYESKVILHIYNTLGQVVARLVDNVESAGFKSVEWNASNMAGGVYFYRLEAMGIHPFGTNINDPSKSFMQVRKMLLIK